MTYLADRQRHLICVPRTRARLLAMADDLGIPRHWYHATPGQPHIDIPKRQIDRVLADPRVTIVSPRVIAQTPAEGEPQWS